MFQFGTFNAHNIANEYRADPQRFVANVIEGLGTKQFTPGEFSLRGLAEGIMGKMWVDYNCPTPPGSSMHRMLNQSGGTLESFDGGEAREFSKTGDGGEFSDTAPPNYSAVMPWNQVGRVNKSLLESVRTTSQRSGYRKVALLENDAVRHSHFMNIVGQIYYNEVLKAYQNEDYTQFQSKIESRASDILDSMEKMASTSTIGNVFDDTIPEGDAYEAVGLTENYIHVGPKAKRGKVVKITKEAIKGNKTGDLLQSAETLGRGLAMNIENRVIDAIIDENTGAKSAVLGGHRYHWRDTSYATYQTSTPWINVKTSNGLSDYTNIEEAWKLFVGMTDPYTGEPIEIMPKELIVTTENVVTANRLLRASQVRVGDITTGDGIQTHSDNPIQGILPGLTPMSSARLTQRAATDTDWWLANIREAVRRYYVWDLTPESFGGGTQQDIFHDVVQIIKVSLMDIVSVVEPRALQENRQ